MSMLLTSGSNQLKSPLNQKQSSNKQTSVKKKKGTHLLCYLCLSHLLHFLVDLLTRLVPLLGLLQSLLEDLLILWTQEKLNHKVGDIVFYKQHDSDHLNISDIS